jgi:hypothetical protein
MKVARTRGSATRTIVSIIFPLAVAPIAGAQSFFGEPLKGTLCRIGETVMFACPSGDKKIAVCASPFGDSAFGFLQYRFGDGHKLDLAFPRQPVPLRSYASGNQLGDGSRGELTYLRLVNGDTSYTVFSETVNPSYQGADAHERHGVIVESNGNLLGKRMCDPDARAYTGMLSDPKFFGVAVPLERTGLRGFPGYRP